MAFSLEEIWVHPYRLRRRGTGRVVEEVLLRWGDGVGCLQPWPELGTASLAQELAALKAGEPLMLGRRALEMAGLDGIGRGGKFSLWEEVRLPRCHRLVLAGETPQEAGRRPVKVKVGAELELLSEWLAWGVACGQMVRADANAGEREAADWLRWWRGLDAERQAKLEFIEDPLLRREVAGWEELAAAGMPLAWDWQKPPGTGGRRAWQAGVFKPGARASLPIAAGTAGEMALAPPQLVLSGMLGHPLGELYAAWVAGRWSQPGSTPASWRISRWHGVSGWETLEDAQRWMELLGPDDEGLLRRPEGAGLGLGTLLEPLMWRRLV